MASTGERLPSFLPPDPKVEEQYLHGHFHIAVRTRELSGGRGYRLYQTRPEGSRHLVDLRTVSELPSARRIAGVLVLEPAGLIASKVIAYQGRRGQPKSGTDWRDLAMLLVAQEIRPLDEDDDI